MQTMTSSLAFWGYFLLLGHIMCPVHIRMTWNSPINTGVHPMPKDYTLTLPYVVHTNRHPKEFWFGPDMSIELYLLVKTLSIKSWNCRNCFRSVHYVGITTPPTLLTRRTSSKGEILYPSKEVSWMRPCTPNASNHSGPRGPGLPWTMKLWQIPKA